VHGLASHGEASMKARILCLGVGAALAVAASPLAQAQFMTGTYPVIIVPPPAQNFVVPKPKPTPPPKTNDARPPALDQSKCYQGRARVC
jgi:hypothetical protein